MARQKFASDTQDQFMVRMPNGLRDRVKKAAQRSGRSMNAEIVAALETYYPEEPTIEEVLDKVHNAIEMASQANGLPYRKVLIESLDQLSEQISGGMELDQFRAPFIGPEYRNADRFSTRFQRWKRVQKYGVETSDFERELERGMFSKLGRDRVYLLLQWFREGKINTVLKNLRLSETKFADPTSALERLHRHLDEFYRENWGDPNETLPWDDHEFD